MTNQKAKGGWRAGSGRKPKNPFKFREDVRYYLEEADIKKALKVIMKKIGDDDRDSAKFLIEQAFGQAMPRDDVKEKTKRTILMLPPKDEDIQKMVDSGRIKIPVKPVKPAEDETTNPEPQ